jgi:hypothetical protein
LAKGLGFREQGVALSAGLLAPMVEIYLRRGGFQACQRRLLQLARLRIVVGDKPLDMAEIQHLAAVVSHGCTHYAPYSPVCLTRSLVLQFMLERRGVSSRLRLGTKNAEGWFAAHAWVEVAGHALIEPGSDRDEYVAFEDSDRIAR